MFRSLSMLRRNFLMARIIYSKRTTRATLMSSSRIRSKPKDILNDVSITDINIHDLAKEDSEFTRNFMTSLSSLSNTLTSTTEAIEPERADETEAATSDINNAEGINRSGVLDKDGVPIVPIEIDGWKNCGDDDEDGPTVNSAGSRIEIGNDNDYKADNMLQVPEKREGQFEYKGIKLKLPESANNDIGTYRFRRDKVDLESVADDIRLVKYDKK